MRRGDAKELWAIALLAAIVASPLTLLVLGTAWELNPHGLVHELGARGALVIHWRWLLLVGGTRFVPVFVSVCLVYAVVRAAIEHVRRRDG